MGFKRGDLFVTFEPGHDLAGLEVRMKRLSVRKLMETAALADEATGDGDDQSTQRMVQRVADSLISWNLEEDAKDDDGKPVQVPVGIDYESLLDQDFSMILQVIHQWISKASGVPAPLDQPSLDGGQSEALSTLPMDSL